MAKKSVASLQKKGSKKLTKVVRMVKSPKTSAYVFLESIIDSDKVNEFLKDKP